MRETREFRETFWRLCASQQLPDDLQHYTVLLKVLLSHSEANIEGGAYLLRGKEDRAVIGRISRDDL